MPMIKVNNANFYYELHGKGKPVILVAGYTCDYSTWQLMMGELGKHFQILIFDNRGVGRTADDNGKLSAELMAQDVIALSEALQLESPYVVGHSMGGTIAQTIAVNFPDKISKLCLLNTSAKWREAMLRGLKSLLMLRQKNIEFDLILESTLPWVFGEAFLENRQTIAEFKKNILEKPYPQSLDDQARQFNVLTDFDSRSRLKNIKSSTLIVCGSQDVISLPTESEYMASQIPKSKLVELDCAHGITLEKPNELAMELIKFFM